MLDARLLSAFYDTKVVLSNCQLSFWRTYTNFPSLDETPLETQCSGKYFSKWLNFYVCECVLYVELAFILSSMWKIKYHQRNVGFRTKKRGNSTWFCPFCSFFSKRNLISIETLYLKRNYCKVYLSSVNYALDLKETDNKIEWKEEVAW